MVGTAFLSFSEKFIALLESVDDVAIEPLRWDVRFTRLCFSKGWTIRKVMGGGEGREGEFSSCRNFFSLSNSLCEYFLGHGMNVF